MGRGNGGREHWSPAPFTASLGSQSILLLASSWSVTLSSWGLGPHPDWEQPARPCVLSLGCSLCVHSFESHFLVATVAMIHVGSWSFALPLVHFVSSQRVKGRWSHMTGPW